jgi:hypothetical protein
MQRREAQAEENWSTLSAEGQSTLDLKNPPEALLCHNKEFW